MGSVTSLHHMYMVDPAWYDHITTARGPHFTAILILSEIVYWYRPASNGKAKYHGKQLQLDNNYFVKKLKVSPKRVQIALKHLRELGLITTKRGQGRHQYIKPLLKDLEKISSLPLPTLIFKDSQVDKNVHHEKNKRTNSSTMNGRNRPLSLDGIVHLTYTTTENTTKNTCTPSGGRSSFGFLKSIPWEKVAVWIESIEPDFAEQLMEWAKKGSEKTKIRNKKAYRRAMIKRVYAKEVLHMADIKCDFAYRPQHDWFSFD